MLALLALTTHPPPSPPRAGHCPRRGPATPIPPGLTRHCGLPPPARGGALPPLLEKATREKLTAEEAAPLAEAHVLLSCMGRIMQKTFSKSLSRNTFDMSQ